jgi:hypothetical protein
MGNGGGESEDECVACEDDGVPPPGEAELQVGVLPPRADGLFAPIRPASLAQLLEVTKDVSELTRVLVAPLGLSPHLQLVDDRAADSGVPGGPPGHPGLAIVPTLH